MRTDRYSQKPQKKKRSALKMLLPLIFLLIVVNAGAGYYSYKTTLDSLNVQFTENVPSVEVGGTYQAVDYVRSFKGVISASDEYLDTDTIGGKELTFTVSQPMFGGLLNPTKEFSFRYKVVDTVPPLILWDGTGAVLEKGTEFNISDVMGFGDNADPKPSVTVKGKVKMNKEGTYPLHVTVSDSSGNQTECKIKVEVSESIPVYTDDSERINFKKFVSTHAGKNRAFGIDVSEWQGDINFKAVKSAGCEFVMIRIGYSVNGKVTVDGRFDQNFLRAKEAGLKVGVYLFSYDNTIEKVRASAEWVVNKLGGSALDLPVAFDWEDFGQFQTYDMSFNDLNRLYDVFSEQITMGGYECMLYGSMYFLETVWQETDSRPVWLAHYTDKTSYKGPYRIWQASSSGRIKGIDGAVDLDIMYY